MAINADFTQVMICDVTGNSSSPHLSKMEQLSCCATVSAVVASAFRGICRAFTLIPSLERDGSLANHAIQGGIGFAHILSVYTGFCALRRAEKIHDQEGVACADAQIRTGQWSAIGVGLQVGAVVIAQGAGAALMVVGSHAVLVTASIYSIWTGVQNINRCIQFEQEWTQNQDRLLTQWSELFNGCSDETVLKCQMDQLQRRIGLQGLKVLHANRELLACIQAAQETDEYSLTEEQQRQKAQLILDVNQAILTQKRWEILTTACAVIGLILFVASIYFSGGAVLLLVPLLMLVVMSIRFAVSHHRNSVNEMPTYDAFHQRIPSTRTSFESETPPATWNQVDHLDRMFLYDMNPYSSAQNESAV